jgi:hypothetical protein
MLILGLINKVFFFHSKQFSGTARVQDRGYSAHLTDHSLERILVLLSFQFGSLHVFSLEVIAGASETQVVITSQYKYIVGEFAALGTRDRLFLKF